MHQDCKDPGAAKATSYQPYHLKNNFDFIFIFLVVMSKHFNAHKQH